jgi:hypothetical protein
MKPSVLTVSFLIYVLGFLFIMLNNPNLFNDTGTDKCFMMFFLTGISAVIVYHLVFSLYG